MQLFATYTFGQALLTVLELALLFLWIWLAITVVIDVFRSHDLSGWAKAGWLVLIVLLPLLGVLIYIIARGHGMAERSAKQMQHQQQQMDDYIKQTAGESNVGDQLHKLDELRSKGSISQEEFDSAKAKLLT